MLDFGGAGSGGRGNSHMILIFGAIVVPSNRPSMPERAWVSSSSLVVGVDEPPGSVRSEFADFPC